MIDVPKRPREEVAAEFNAELDVVAEQLRALCEKAQDHALRLGWGDRQAQSAFNIAAEHLERVWRGVEYARANLTY